MDCTVCRGSKKGPDTTDTSDIQCTHVFDTSSESNGNPADETVNLNENANENSSESSGSSSSSQFAASTNSSPNQSLEDDTFFYESDRTVIAPPNTPKERYESSPETDGQLQSNSPYSPSTPNDLDRALKVSKLAQELRVVLGQCPPSTHQGSQEPPLRLHNLGYEDYDRVDNWRYHVFYETLMPLTLDTEHKPFAQAVREQNRGRINSSSGIYPHKWKYKRAKSAPWKVNSGTRPGAWSADSSSSQTGEERDEAILIQRMGRMSWQKSPVEYDIPNPKFLQKLFV